MNTIPDSVSFSQLCSLLKTKGSQDDFAQEVALDWEDRLSEILFELQVLWTTPPRIKQPTSSWLLDHFEPI